MQAIHKGNNKRPVYPPIFSNISKIYRDDRTIKKSAKKPVRKKTTWFDEAGGKKVLGAGMVWDLRIIVKKKK